MSHPITQHELARLAGVSQRTVNRALAGHPDVNVATRERVREIARRHGYRPNAAARVMRGAGTGCVALVLRPDGQAVPAQLLEGVVDGLAAHGRYPALTRIRDPHLPDSPLPPLLADWQAEGLLVCYAYDHQSATESRLQGLGLPMVWLSHDRPEDAVCHDDLAAAELGVRHLLSRGRRRIGYCHHSNSGGHHSGADRLRGYRQALAGSGVVPFEEVSNRTLRNEERLPRLRTWLGSVDRPDALLAYGVHDALAVLMAAVQVGLRVPEDLSVVAIHSEKVTNGGITLTTVILDEAEMGRQATELLVRKLDTGQTQPGIRVRPTLSLGASAP